MDPTSIDLTSPTALLFYCVGVLGGAVLAVVRYAEKKLTERLTKGETRTEKLESDLVEKGRELFAANGKIGHLEATVEQLEAAQQRTERQIRQCSLGEKCGLRPMGGGTEAARSEPSS